MRKNSDGRIAGFFWTVVLLFLLIYFNDAIAQPDILWTQIWGGTTNDYLRRAQPTSDGGFIAVGWTFSFGTGNGDIWLIKTDASGDSLWTRTYSGAGTDRGYSVQQTSDGGYIIVGETYISGSNYKVWLIKTDSSGNMEWNSIFGGVSNDRCYSVEQTTDGGYFLVGESNSYGDICGDILLIKTDSLGNESWMQLLGEDWWFDYARHGGQTADGGYIVTGWKSYMDPTLEDGSLVLIKTDSLGIMVWEQNYIGDEADRGESVQQTVDGGYFITARTLSYGAGDSDVWWIKTNEYGNITWSNTYGGTGNDRGQFGQELNGDGYILTGYTESYGAGGKDIWVIRTNLSGIVYWTKTIGGVGDEISTGVQQTPDGGYIVAGYTDSYGAGGYEAFLVRIESDLGIEESSPEASPVLGVSPNPSSGQVNISYLQQTDGWITLAVYDLAGRKLEDIFNGFSIQGEHTISWNPKDNNTGVYLILLETPTSQRTAKLLLYK